MELHYKIVGLILVLLSFAHGIFPRYFSWDEELKSLSLINRQMVYVHTFFIGLIVFMNGLLCLYCSNELITTPFGKKIALAIGVFWAIRLFIQFFGYSSKLWKGKRFETMVHILFSILWAYLSFVFIFTYFNPDFT
jgi:hypothetical protein